MVVSKRKNSNSWGYDFRDVFNQRHQKQGFRTKVEAQRAEAEALAQANKGGIKTNYQLLFKEISAEFIENYAKVYLKPSTFNNYNGNLERYILPYFKDIKIMDIKPHIVNNFIKEISESGLSPRSANHIITTLKRVFSYAIKNYYINFDPTIAVQKLTVNEDNRGFLEFEELDKLLTWTKKNMPDFYPLLLTASKSGLRRGELLALTWDDIDFKEKKINVDKALFDMHLGTPKTKASIRKIDVPISVIKTLKKWKKNCPKGDLNLVFPNQNGTYLDGKNMLRRHFKKAWEGAGLKKIKFHDLRHTYASHLIDKKLKIHYIKKQMGHASTKMTLDTYGHLLESSENECKSIIDSL